MKPIVRAGLAAALLLTFIACGGDSGNDDGPSGSGSPDIADITDRALALADLPTGWAEDNSDDEDDDDNTLDCLRLIEDEENNAGVTGRAKVVYMEGAGVPSLTQIVAQFDAADSAAVAAETFDGILDACGSFEEETDDGEPFEGQIGQVSFPDVPGVDSQATYQLTGTTSGITVTAAVLLLQVDDYVTFLNWIDLGSFDADAVLDVATTAVEKLAS